MKDDGTVLVSSALAGVSLLGLWLGFIPAVVLLWLAVMFLVR